MRILILLLIAGILLLAGCTQMVKDVGNELGTCMAKCNQVCDLVKGSNVSLDGYDNLGLAKQSGSVTVKCNCLCAG